jgi:glutathione peroxidase
MKLLITAIILTVTGVLTTSIYTKQFTTLNGTQVSLAQYQGKKMLLVNIASQSEYAAIQLPQLQQLYLQYKDSLEVIAFPSNDFGKEPKNNADLKLLLQNTYHISFPVSVLSTVKDSTAATTHPVYKWLQSQAENGSTNKKLIGDFQKYLIDKDGTILGVFSASTAPMSSGVINAITQ